MVKDKMDEVDEVTTLAELEKGINSRRGYEGPKHPRQSTHQQIPRPKPRPPAEQLVARIKKYDFKICDDCGWEHYHRPDTDTECRCIKCGKRSFHSRGNINEGAPLGSLIRPCCLVQDELDRIAEWKKKERSRDDRGSRDSRKS